MVSLPAPYQALVKLILERREHASTHNLKQVILNLGYWVESARSYPRYSNLTGQACPMGTAHLVVLLCGENHWLELGSPQVHLSYQGSVKGGTTHCNSEQKPLEMEENFHQGHNSPCPPPPLPHRVLPRWHSPRVRCLRWLIRGTVSSG